MKYVDVRKKFKTGDIVAWSHGDWKTYHGMKVNMIRIGTRSEYSHVGLVWVVGGRIMVVEAVVPMIRIFPISRLLSFYHIKMPKKMSKQAEEYMLSKVGEEYSQLEAITAFFKGIKNGANSTWQCAEFVNSCWGIDIPDFNDVAAIPSATIKYCLETLNATMTFVE